MAQGAISSGAPLEDVHTRTTASGPQSLACVVGVDGVDSPVNAQSTPGLRVDRASNVIQSSGHGAVGGTPTSPIQVSSTSIPCKSVFVTARPGNLQRIVVGDININPSDANLRGIPLQPGQQVSIDVGNVNQLYFHVLTARPSPGEGLDWVAIS